MNKSDILLAAREQTTVLFSTHILSDVERICTAAAFLNNGKIPIQGTIAELRNKCFFAIMQFINRKQL